MRASDIPPIPEIDWLILLPIVLVVGTGVVALIVEMTRPKRSNLGIVWTCILGLGATMAALVVQFPMEDKATFADMIVRDRSALVLQLVLVAACLLSILFSEGYLREKRIAFGEFYPLAVWSTAGGMVMVSTDNLLMLFLGLEMLSIALYVMAGMSRSEAKSEESAIKYFLLGAFSSAFLLYGLAFVFGATGSLFITDVAEAWNTEDPATRNLLVFGLGMALIGLAFKSSFVPFHMWTPDVYQGAPTNVTAFMAGTSKIAAFGALFRVLDGSLSLIDFWMPFLFWLALLTMTLGNLVAMWQKDVKRILGYSAISNGGYMLVAVLAHLQMPDRITFAATIFYLINYMFMTIGAFAVISLTTRAGLERTELTDLHGLWKKAPIAAAALVVFMASLIGVPPTGGFLAKLLIFQDALTAGLTTLAIAMAVNSVISAYYYLRIAQAAFVDEEGADRLVIGRVNAGLVVTCLVCAVGIFAVMFVVTPLERYIAGP